MHFLGSMFHFFEAQVHSLQTSGFLGLSRLERVGRLEVDNAIVSEYYGTMDLMGKRHFR